MSEKISLDSSAQTEIIPKYSSKSTLGHLMTR